MYIYHSLAGRKVYSRTREEWMEALRLQLFKPKPPEWWLDSQQREEKRSRQTASIIWGSRYDAGRRYLIWANAPLSDFVRLGYFEG
jgi:hypothetical protein